MKLVVLQSDLNSALLKVSRFASSRAQLPILGNVIFRTDKNKLELLATNLEMSIATSIGAKVIKEGEVAVPAKTINDLVGGLNDGQITLSLDKETLRIESSGVDSTLMCMNSSDFPQIPQKTPKKAIQIKFSDFQKALSKTLFAVSSDETRPVLTGVLFSLTKSGISIVATDGFRLSQYNLAAKVDKFDVIIPRAILLELLRGDGNDLHFNYQKADNQVVFVLDESILSSRVINGEFPNYKRIIPSSSDYTIITDTAELAKAIKLSGVFARDSSNVVRFKLSKNSIEIYSESKSSGKNEVSVECKLEGNLKANNPLEIAFNYKFIEDVLNSIDSDSVQIGLTTEEDPAVFTDPSDKASLHLVMPVKI